MTPDPTLAPDRSDSAPTLVTLTLGERAIQVPGWWAEANGYRPDDSLRADDVERAQTVSLASRGALAAMDRVIARRRRRRGPRRRPPPPSLRLLAAVAALAAAATLAAVYALSLATP